MIRLGCVPILIFLVLLFLFPFLFGQVMISALVKLHIDPNTALILVVGMFLGSAVNFPIKRIVRHEEMAVQPPALLGIFRIWPQVHRVRRETVIAVNAGGCLIPTGVAVYETAHLAVHEISSLTALAVCVLLNTAVCYRLARPVEGIGIAMPALIPPLVAASSALILAGSQATPVAFVAGVIGPLLGADLLHLRDIPKISTGLASIGGAGTFDGIVLSGILAAYLA
jgi:uncharacterized membrane protein